MSLLAWILLFCNYYFLKLCSFNAISSSYTNLRGYIRNIRLSLWPVAPFYLDISPKEGGIKSSDHCLQPCVALIVMKVFEKSEYILRQRREPRKRIVQWIKNAKLIIVIAHVKRFCNTISGRTKISQKIGTLHKIKGFFGEERKERILSSNLSSR